jgi:RNA-directed DNA polymerase
MQVPYGEDLAGHTGPESFVGTREGDGEALTGVRAGWPSSPERSTSGMPRRFPNAEGHTNTPQSHGCVGPAGSKTPCTHASTSQERTTLSSGSREVHGSAHACVGVGPRHESVKGER